MPPSYGSSVVRGTNPTFVTGANGANALLPLDVSRDIIKSATQKSAALTMFKHRNMTTAQQRMPVLSTKPDAFWITGDTGIKPTTNVSWENKFLDAEEIAVIVPIPEKLLDDSDYNIWGEIKPELEEAIAVALDLAVFFGINKPSSWPSAIATAAIAAGNTVTTGASSPNIDLAGNISDVMAAVEADGFEPNGFWMKNTMKASLRNLREATTNAFMFLPNNPGVENTVFKGTLFGEKAVASMSGVFEAQTGANQIDLITGDWNQGLIGIRQDITYKMLTEASLFDTAGALMFNLPQQDMVALRVVARFAFQVPNPINRMNLNNAQRYPFAVLRHAT